MSIWWWPVVAGEEYNAAAVAARAGSETVLHLSVPLPFLCRSVLEALFSPMAETLRSAAFLPQAAAKEETQLMSELLAALGAPVAAAAAAGTLAQEPQAAAERPDKETPAALALAGHQLAGELPEAEAAEQVRAALTRRQKSLAATVGLARLRRYLERLCTMRAAVVAALRVSWQTKIARGDLAALAEVAMGLAGMAQMRLLL